MLKWKCPPLLIMLVLLIRWHDGIKHSIDSSLGSICFFFKPSKYSIKNSFSQVVDIWSQDKKSYHEKGGLSNSSQDRDFLEVFAGQQAVTNALREASRHQ